MIGSGYGITAGALALYEQMERVDAMEILPAMVAAAPLFEPHNFSYQERANVNVVVGDGWHFLLRENSQYDILPSNVCDPHLPGGATLFHLDLYALAKRHLKPGGVVIQHVVGGELPIIAATMAAGFPSVCARHGGASLRYRRCLLSSSRYLGNVNASSKRITIVSRVACHARFGSLAWVECASAISAVVTDDQFAVRI